MPFFFAMTPVRMESGVHWAAAGVAWADMLLVWKVAAITERMALLEAMDLPDNTDFVNKLNDIVVL